ncbi:hypothetical protein RUND412_001430 [Rhizina undulata]
MGNEKKRRNNTGKPAEMNSSKRSKTKEYWRKVGLSYQSITGIESGTQGIFATCDRRLEPKCVMELYGLLEKVTARLYGLNFDEKREEGSVKEEVEEEEEEEEEDIEAAIRKEIAGMKDKKKNKKEKEDKPFVSVKLDAQCVVFFRMKPPCVPTEMVYALCEEAEKARGDSDAFCNFTHRLTPVSRVGKATLEGITELAKEVLAPHFHAGQECVKFAIRPTTRNHNVLHRDEIIKCVADVVGGNHKADLKNPDVIIMVELYKNICGISVVRNWERFKKFSLMQLQKKEEGVLANQIKRERGEQKEASGENEKVSSSV